MSIHTVATTEGSRVTITNEHFLAVGNDEDGNGMLVVTSRLSSSFTVFTLNGHSVSSACGSHPSRCRELMVESITVSNLMSRHIVFIPLENGIQILELYHDGTRNELSLSTQHTLMFSGVSNCSSLGVYKIGAGYYLPCVNTESLFICELTLNTTPITQSTIQGCRRMLDTREVGLMDISNIVPSKDVFVSRRHLLVLLQGALYRLYPVRNSYLLVNVLPSQCASVNLLLPSPKDDNELLVYCRDRTSIVYDTDFDQIVNSVGLESVQYPCSQSAEFIIHLTQNLMDFSYKLRSNGSDTVKIFVSPTTSADFHSGVCFDYSDHHLFAYIDQRMGVFVFNATSENFTLLPNTQSCSDRNCELLLMYNNQYLVVRSREERKVSVFDLLQGRLIISLKNTTFQLVTLIHDTFVIPAPLEPTTTSTTLSVDTVYIPTIESNMKDVDTLSSGVIAAAVVISMTVVILFIAIIVVAIVGIVMVRKRR